MNKQMLFLNEVPCLLSVSGQGTFISCSLGGTLAERGPERAQPGRSTLFLSGQSCSLGMATLFFFKQFSFQFHMQTLPARKEIKWPVERSRK